MWKLTIEILSDWHVGSGNEGGAYADQLVVKDINQLPFIPGRAIKGLVKHAVSSAVELGWYEGLSTQSIVHLFGQESRFGLSEQGIFQWSNASLSQHECDFLVQNPSWISSLYRTVSSTAIDDTTGTAQQHSLRSIEVVVPMQLFADIDVNIELAERYGYSLEQLQHILSTSLTLIHEFGAKRKRGLGQVNMTLQATDAVKSSKEATL